MGILPRYPVYIISKGRFDNPLTARFLKRDGVWFRIVVEPQEQEAYEAAVGREHVLVLPFSNLGKGSIPARNWVWEHAIATESGSHWILDDNIRGFRRSRLKNRIPCASGPAFAAMEDFADRYENVAIAGPNYSFFARPAGKPYPPFRLNCHVYSTLLIRNDLPYRWRGRYNEDTDLCLQVLSGGWCTIQYQAFLIEKAATMTMKGGNSDELYQGDGRLKMARSLQRVWPGVVETKRRFGRPQHTVNWRRFRTPLKLRPDAKLPERPEDYGFKLREVG